MVGDDGDDGRAGWDGDDRRAGRKGDGVVRAALSLGDGSSPLSRQAGHLDGRESQPEVRSRKHWRGGPNFRVAIKP